RRSRGPPQRGVLHRECGPDARPVRLPEGPTSEARDRLARAASEEGRRVALLSLQHRNARLLGGARRVLGASDRLAYPRDPPGDRAGRGVLSQATTVPRGCLAVPSLVSPPLPRPLLLRPSRRPRRAHVPEARGRSANPSGPRPAHRDAQPRRELEHGCIASGLGGPRVPIPGSVLSPWLGGGWTPKPMDYDDGPTVLKRMGEGLRRRDVDEMPVNLKILAE